MGVRIAAVVACVVFGVCLANAAVSAAFPGQNGKIAFVRTGADGVNHVWLMENDGSNPVEFTHGRDPAWSPDGQRLAFVRGRSADLFVVNADGTGEQMIFSGGFAGSPHWTPDGNKITFVRTFECGASGCDNHLVTVNADGTEPMSLLLGNAFDPAWSPSGARLAYVSYDWDFGIGEVALTNPHQQLCCEGNPPPAGLSWSPDGSALVFGYARRIAKRNTDGSGSTLFLSPPGGPYENSPDWSPDGQKIVFWRDPVEGPPGGIYVMDADGTDAVRLTDGSWPAWQPIPINAYTRPRAASPQHLSLVPAYEQCTSGNHVHGPPLAFPSCAPPVREPGQLTVGTPDSNGKPAKNVGELWITVMLGNPSTPADEADVHIHGEVRDVRLASDLSDYTGSLEARVNLRITDKNNTPHPGGPGAGTVQDQTYTFPIPCSPTADTTVGSHCPFDTSADALLPGAVTEGRRAIWELGQLSVHDGGGDVFLRQGIFVP